MIDMKEKRKLKEMKYNKKGLFIKAKNDTRFFFEKSVSFFICAI